MILEFSLKIIVENCFECCLFFFGWVGRRAYFCIPLKKWDDLVAQLVEHNTFNVGAQGSSPCGITKASRLKSGGFFYTIYFGNEVNKVCISLK